jgi:hypothetical protein
MITFWIVCFAVSFLNNSIQEDVWYKLIMGQYIALVIYSFALFVFAPYYALGWVLSLLGHFENRPRI